MAAGQAPWPGAQLRLVDHPLVAVTSMLHPIPQLLSLNRQQPLDCVSPAGHVPFQPIGHQIDRLSDLEFVMCHATSRRSRRRSIPAPGMPISECVS